VSDDFKLLFEALCKENPADRPTIKQVKEMKWYRGMTCAQDLKKIFRCSKKTFTKSQP
jgi:hypothetical protein